MFLLNMRRAWGCKQLISLLIFELILICLPEILFSGNWTSEELFKKG